MPTVMERSWGRRLAATMVGAALLAGSAGCNIADDGDNLVNGKQKFVAKCGSCHVMKRAGTTGIVGPNLDEAFQRARVDGIPSSTINGIVLAQIDSPIINAQFDPNNPKRRLDANVMPADLVQGEDAEDVAAYVARVVARPGEDTGALADAVKAPTTDEPIAAEDGKLDIPADSTGRLLYVATLATASPGPLTITSLNESSVPHNIALEGNGVNEIGEVVQDGGTSEIQVTVEPGEYTFYCSVPGHREGGMVGELTVE